LLKREAREGKGVSRGKKKTHPIALIERGRNPETYRVWGRKRRAPRIRGDLSLTQNKEQRGLRETSAKLTTVGESVDDAGRKRLT